MVHAHGNNCSNTTNINGKYIPDVIELTYIRKDCVTDEVPLNDIRLPLDIDTSNNPSAKDFNLNFKPFTN